MKIVNIEASKGTWVEYPTDPSVEIKIKPLSIYDFDKLPSEDVDITVKEFAGFLVKLVVDWKGICDEKKKPLECNEENKKIISDHDQELAAFIINKASELKASIVTDDEVKN